MLTHTSTFHMWVHDIVRRILLYLEYPSILDMCWMVHTRCVACDLTFVTHLQRPVPWTVMRCPPLSLFVSFDLFSLYRSRSVAMSACVFLSFSLSGCRSVSLFRFAVFVFETPREDRETERQTNRQTGVFVYIVPRSIWPYVHRRGVCVATG